ncbi:MAG: hypothetical protein ACD_28C00102G0002 [uncultured bacterium]|nr:MAG: hypothetical protein ACD_28C00102G0002 [uncultured bacterium]
MIIFLEADPRWRGEDEEVERVVERSRAVDVQVLLTQAEILAGSESLVDQDRALELCYTILEKDPENQIALKLKEDLELF